MSDLICLHIGQAGVQIAESTWELLCLEHGIGPEGEGVSSRSQSEDWHSDEGQPGSGILFREAANGKRIPRAILLDTEESVISERMFI